MALCWFRRAGVTAGVPALLALVAGCGSSPAPRAPGRGAAPPAVAAVSGLRGQGRALGAAPAPPAPSLSSARAPAGREDAAAAARGAAARAAAASCRSHPPVEHPITHRRWLSGVIVTEYYPVPEGWFSGRQVPVPGLGGRHRVDWLYSALGLSMEGDGVDSSGRLVHIHDLGSVGWVNAAGRATVPPRCGIAWSHGPPYWRAGGWRNAHGAVTYPLAGGGWSNGRGRLVGGYGGTTFAAGASLPLTPYRSVAVDPRLIPEGSRIYIPAYRRINGGWFVARDTGGAIVGRHIDVYRPPTPQRFGSGRLLLSARVLVVPPGG